jgi:hypothetical protein
MICFKLTNNEIERIRHAAELKGFPWEAIVERPKTARRFLKRVEGELARETKRVHRIAIGAPALAAA